MSHLGAPDAVDMSVIFLYLAYPDYTEAEMDM